MSTKDRKPINFNDYKLRPAGSYLSDYSALLRSIRDAETAVNVLDKENAEKAAAPNVLTPDAPKTEAEKSPEKPNLDELLAELDSLVGLDNIKKNVRSLINLVKVRKLREENDLETPPMSLHLVFMGNPGTGKTTVARLISKLYCAIGVLSKGQLVEVDRSGLVAGFVGQTAIKTGEAIKKAMGGVLFIDEAYALAPGGDGTDFGREAIEAILKAMEDHRDDLVVIVAGYEDLMEQFISSNPGLESRFNRYFVFSDYSADELYAIFDSMCKKNQYSPTEEAVKALKSHLTMLYETRDENFGNARDVRNFFENVMSVHSDRVAAMEAPTRDDLITILPEDVNAASLM